VWWLSGIRRMVRHKKSCPLSGATGCRGIRVNV
jgi:hypothetical protein